MATTRVETSHMLMSTVLPPQEARDLFERKAQDLLHMTGEEFLSRWDAGEFRNLLEAPETPETRKIMRVAALIPFGRR